jgi:hypothetical protein
MKTAAAGHEERISRWYSPVFKTWKIVGEHLELFDASGVLLARFEARYLK